MWWARSPKPGNVGDLVGPYLYRKDTGRAPRYADQSNPDLLTCGSIVRFARKDTVVWGSGHMRDSDDSCPDADYRAVRGPLTKAMIEKAGGVVPDMLCDPALCLPLVYDPHVRQDGMPGLVPHYTDLDECREWVKHHDGWQLISPLTDDVEAFVRQILTCPYVCSSSLHGLVIPLAYDIHAAWVKIGDGVNGEGFKFRDFGASIEWDATPGQLDDFMGAWVRMPEMNAAKRYSKILDMWRARPWQ